MRGKHKRYGQPAPRVDFALIRQEVRDAVRERAEQLVSPIRPMSTGLEFHVRSADEAALLRLTAQLEQARRPWAGRWPALSA